MQLALSDDSRPSQAVLFALLAFSFLHRDGPNARSVRFHSMALRALAQSAASGHLGPAAAAQHVAAGMVLGSLEVGTPLLQDSIMDTTDNSRSIPVGQTATSGYSTSAAPRMSSPPRTSMTNSTKALWPNCCTGFPITR